MNQFPHSELSPKSTTHLREQNTTSPHLVPLPRAPLLPKGKWTRKGHADGREDGMSQKPTHFNGSEATAEQASECEEALEAL